MADIRPELSKRSKYYIDKNRYYELKYYCLQYPIWKKKQAQIDGLVRKQSFIFQNSDSQFSDPIFSRVRSRTYYTDNIKLVEDSAKLSDPVLSSYVLMGVTNGLSYNTLRTKYSIPCGRDMYYERYRRFFWILDMLKRKDSGDYVQ